MKKGRGLWHGLLMMVCCLVPMLLLVMFIGRGSGVGGGFGWIFLLICPLMHIFMMKGMMGGHKHDDNSDVKDLE